MKVVEVVGVIDNGLETQQVWWIGWSSWGENSWWRKVMANGVGVKWKNMSNSYSKPIRCVKIAKSI